MRASIRYALGVAFIIAMIAFVLVINANASSQGSDDIISNMIRNTYPGFKSWFAPIYQLPPEIETLFLIAAIVLGTFVIIYFIGHTPPESIARKQEEKKKENGEG